MDPLWAPPFFVDERVAWEGPLPSRPDLRARVEAASYRGEPAWFSVILPWTEPDRMVDDVRFGSRKLALGFIVLIFFAMTTTAGFLARRHLVMGRGDRRGAFRVSMAVFVLGGASWALRADHAGDLASEVGLVVRGQGGCSSSPASSGSSTSHSNLT